MFQQNPLKKPLKDLIFSKVAGHHPTVYGKMNFFVKIFRALGALCTFQRYSFQGTPLSGCFHNDSNNSKIPRKSCRGNLYKFRGKRLCRMQILLAVEELNVSIDNGRGGILIK